MKNVKKVILCFVMIFACMVTVIPSIQADAASTSSRAKAAYKRLLAHHKYRYQTEEQLWNYNNKDKNKNYDYFYIKDINGDKVPELFTVTIVGARYEVVRLFTYKSGKVKLIKKFDNNHWANGAYSIYLCKKNHIHNVWSGSNPITDDIEKDSKIYKFKKRKLSIVKRCNSPSKVYIYSKAKKNTKKNRSKIR